MIDKKVITIAHAMLNSRKITLLTGAGISTESGIPDFRSKKDGLWNRFDSNFLSRDFLYNNPEKFYELALEMFALLKKNSKVKPNKAHYILSQMEKENMINSVITQNIDGLHKLAGSKNVYEVHGSLRKSYCVFCKNEYSFFLLYRKILKRQIPPLCPKCGNILRTSVILFGDELKEEFFKASKEVLNSDLLIVVGSSLEVGPVNTLPSLAKKFIIINKDKTYFDDKALVVLNENASTALSAIYDLIKKTNDIGM